jgi:eukaryotic-like serine/threonine-protein kinase
MTGSTIAGRYRLVERLGAGGMSEVWAADDTELDRRVALKLLGPRADNERFRREARAVATLGHPNVNQLYDYGEADDGRPYMVLECLTGGSLADLLEPGRPLPDDETRRIAGDIAAGLEHAHARGLVHRDLKPANVLFDSEGRAKIADFGIARLGQDGELTETGTVLGTATTMSPEQAAGQAATPASDVYSFGALLFWMLTGRPPFLSDRPLDLLHLHRDATPPAPASLREDVPADLSALATAALAKDPADRPADGGELARRLGASTEATELLPPAAPPPRRRRRAALAGLLGLLLAGIAAAGTAVAIAVVHDGSAGSDVSTPSTVPSLTLPKISTAHTAPLTTATPSTATHATTTEASTHSATTTATRPATTHVISTIAPVTTALPPVTTTYELTTTESADLTTSAVATTTVPG